MCLPTVHSGGRYSKPYSLISRKEGGESDQKERRTGSQTNEPECPYRTAQLIQGRHRSPGPGHDYRSARVHRELRLEAGRQPVEEGPARMKRAALYLRVSTLDQHPETQLHDLRQMAAQRGFEIVSEFTDRISGTKTRRPGLDQLMSGARRGSFDVVLVWASDRIARSVKHFLEGREKLSRLNIEFVSFREQIDTGGPLGRAVVVIIGAIAELERNLIIERVRAGMRRARLEGRHIGRQPLELDRAAILRDRQHGRSLGQLAKTYRVPEPPSTRAPSAHGSCSKRARKSGFITPMKSMAGSGGSGRSESCTFPKKPIPRKRYG